MLQGEPKKKGHFLTQISLFFLTFFSSKVGILFSCRIMPFAIEAIFFVVSESRGVLTKLCPTMANTLAAFTMV